MNPTGIAATAIEIWFIETKSKTFLSKMIAHVKNKSIEEAYNTFTEEFVDYSYLNMGFLVDKKAIDYLRLNGFHVNENAAHQIAERPFFVTVSEKVNSNSFISVRDGGINGQIIFSLSLSDVLYYLKTGYIHPQVPMFKEIT